MLRGKGVFKFSRSSHRLVLMQHDFYFWLRVACFLFLLRDFMLGRGSKCDGDIIVLLGKPHRARKPLTGVHGSSRQRRAAPPRLAVWLCVRVPNPGPSLLNWGPWTGRWRWETPVPSHTACDWDFPLRLLLWEGRPLLELKGDRKGLDWGGETAHGQG